MTDFKKIEGFEDLYTIYSDGRVYSERTGKFLKPSNDRGGYQQVDLRRNGEHNRKTVHRLVASAFIPNPDNKPQVDHIDGDKTNNDVSNLRWATQKENINNPITLERKLKPVLQYSQEGQFIKEWPSAIEIERKLGYDNTSISRCCRGIQKHCGGFIWKYKT